MALSILKARAIQGASSGNCAPGLNAIILRQESLRQSPLLGAPCAQRDSPQTGALTSGK